MSEKKSLPAIRNEVLDQLEVARFVWTGQPFLLADDCRIYAATGIGWGGLR
jgi:hypothetical protein